MILDDEFRDSPKIHHIEVANIPIINPNIFPTAVILPLYNLFDSGTSSP